MDSDLPLLFIPLHDDNPRARRPYAVWTMLGLLATLGVARAAFPTAFAGWAELGAPAGPPPVALLAAPWAALHLPDLAVCLLFLWIFADNVEDRLGLPAFLVAAAIWCTLGSFLHLLLPWDPARTAATPAYFTSAALGAYIALFPRRRVHGIVITLLDLLTPRGLHHTPPTLEEHSLDLPAWCCLPVWMIFQAALLLCSWTTASPAVLALELALGAALALGLRALLGFPPDSADDAVDETPRRLTAGRSTPPLPPPHGPALPAGAGAVPEIRPAAHHSPPLPFGEPDGERGRAATPPSVRAPASADDPAGDPAPPPSVAADEPCAVIRLTDELRDVGVLGRTVARHTGEFFADVTRRLRVTRGFLVQRLPRTRADALVLELAGHQIAAASVPLALAPPCPAATRAVAAGVNAASFVFDTAEGARALLPWPDVTLVAAGRMERSAPARDDGPILVPTAAGMAEVQEAAYVTTASPRACPRVDVLSLARAQRWRVDEEGCHFAPMRELGGPPGLRGFAQALLAHRGAAPINAGVKVLANRGLWGYLDFRSERDFDEYCRWMTLVLAHRRAAARRAQYLE
ncbi:MAG: hypothetical protein HZA54_10440 [Planctomycetes bacterium]|nr:hypothetical protein [Planctomycetota bacterium]